MENLKISEIAKLVNVLPSKIRYYTDMELLEVAGYTAGRQRLYSLEATKKRILQIEWLSRKGKTISEIKQILLEGQLKKILIVDDNPEICDLVSDLVKDKLNNKVELKVAQDGFTAGKLLGDLLPDLIILDIFLPGVSGFEICKQIKQDNYLKETKILAITGYDSSEHKQEIFSAGADDYLAKPMDISVLYMKIKNLLNLKE